MELNKVVKAQKDIAEDNVKIERDWRLLGSIVRPDISTCSLAIAKNWRALELCPIKFTELVKQAMLVNVEAIKFVKAPSEDLVRNCITSSPCGIQYVKQTKSNVLLAIKTDLDAYKYVSDKETYKTEVTKLASKLVRECPRYIEYIDCPTDAQLEFVAKYYAKKEDTVVSGLAYIDNQTRKLVDIGVTANKLNIVNIKCPVLQLEYFFKYVDTLPKLSLDIVYSELQKKPLEVELCMMFHKWDSRLEYVSGSDVNRMLFQMLAGTEVDTSVLSLGMQSHVSGCQIEDKHLGLVWGARLATKSLSSTDFCQLLEVLPDACLTEELMDDIRVNNISVYDLSLYPLRLRMDDRALESTLDLYPTNILLMKSPDPALIESCVEAEPHVITKLEDRFMTGQLRSVAIRLRPEVVTGLKQVTDAEWRLALKEEPSLVQKVQAPTAAFLKKAVTWVDCVKYLKNPDKEVLYAAIDRWPGSIQYLELNRDLVKRAMQSPHWLDCYLNDIPAYKEDAASFIKWLKGDKRVTGVEL